MSRQPPHPPALAASQSWGSCMEGILSFLVLLPLVSQHSCGSNPPWFSERLGSYEHGAQLSLGCSVCETGVLAGLRWCWSQHSSKSSCCPSALAGDACVSSPSLQMMQEPEKSSPSHWWVCLNINFVAVS